MTTHVRSRAGADECARLAADRLGLRITELTDAPSHHVAAALLQGVWRADSPDAVVGAATMTALAHSGNYVAAAYRDDEMIAASLGFFGDGHLHSHVTGVDRATTIRGVGFALKQHQRAWALARGINDVHWTFDPLVGRNARFNLFKLGASATAYLPDFYGALDDGINSDDPSDRLYVRWRLESDRAVAAANGSPVDGDAAKFRGATVLVDRDGDVPVAGRGLPDDRTPVLVAVPEDVEALRSRDPAAAARWRYAVRDAMCEALAAGYAVEGMFRDGFYALAVPVSA